MAAVRLTVALAQIHCPWADNRRNLERMAGWAERAKSGGAALVLFPELCVSGICKDERLAGASESLEFRGPSFVVDPGGRVVAETHDGTEQLVFASLGEDPPEGGA